MRLIIHSNKIKDAVKILTAFQVKYREISFIKKINDFTYEIDVDGEKDEKLEKLQSIIGELSTAEYEITSGDYDFGYYEIVVKFLYFKNLRGEFYQVLVNNYFSMHVTSLEVEEYAKKYMQNLKCYNIEP